MGDPSTSTFKAECTGDAILENLIEFMGIKGRRYWRGPAVSNTSDHVNKKL